MSGPPPYAPPALPDAPDTGDAAGPGGPGGLGGPVAPAPGDESDLVVDEPGVATNPIRSWRTVAVSLAVVIVVGGGIAVGAALASGGGDDRAAAQAPATTAVADPSTVVVTQEPEVVTESVTVAPPEPVIPEPSDSESDDSSSDTQSYSAPGGITVDAPAGWLADGSANLPRIRDYVPPESPSRLAGVNFRIGIGNSRPLDSFTDEVDDAVRNLASSLRSSSGQTPYVSDPSYGSMLGADSADIEYEFHNDNPSLDRHGIERIWWSGSYTMIISVSDISENWSDTQALFTQLVDSASVS